MSGGRKNIMKLVVFAVIICACAIAAYGLDALEYNSVKLVAMAATVLFVENVCIIVLKKLKVENHRGRTLVSLSASLIKYVAALVILCWGLSLIGVDVNTIVTSMGILALVVGFGAESMIADVITGLFMLFENQYNVGDIVEVNGFRGTVQEIGIRTTSIVDAGNNVRIINNSQMTNLLNRSDNRSKAVCDFQIPYETDLEELEDKIPALLESVHESHKELMSETPVYLGVQSLDASGISLRFVVDVSENDIFQANRILNHDLLIGFRKLGVECPYPQLDVHSR